MNVALARTVFRRDARIRRPLTSAFVKSSAPYLAPEITLLYKSKSPGAKDTAYFNASLPRLDDVQHEWLRAALDTTAPGHQWESILSRRA